LISEKFRCPNYKDIKEIKIMENSSHLLKVELTAVLSEVYRFERQGKYDSALEKLQPYWNDYTRPPKIKGLPREEASELLLRCGSLLGFVAKSRRVF
jgi:hypothetical protein